MKYTFEKNDDKYLAHYGVKGMKWKKRKLGKKKIKQYYDGEKHKNLNANSSHQTNLYASNRWNVSVDGLGVIGRGEERHAIRPLNNFEKITKNTKVDIKNAARSAKGKATRVKRKTKKKVQAFIDRIWG